MAKVNDAAWGNYLLQRGIVEEAALFRQRTKVIKDLQSLLQIFADTEGDLAKETVQCELTPFGSFGLGGYIAGSDIDLVCIASSLARRTAFFNAFPKILRNSGRTSYVEVIRRTAVPIIKCTIDNFAIDISFVQLATSTIDVDLLDDTIFLHLGEVEVASLDGPRVHRFVIDHIQQGRLSVFQTCLQCIKHWAKRRSIYGKPLGYLNGGAWTLLLLKVFLRPDTHTYSVSELLQRFFETWVSWPWPQPVLMTDMIPTGAGSGVGPLLTSFDELMPIITPCHPVSSAAPYVSKSTFQVMMNEFDRAHKILQTNFEDPFTQMDKLFKPLDFAKQYRHFLKVTVATETYKSHEIWVRKMAHILPRFVQSIESSPDIAYTHPLTNPFTSRTEYRNEEELTALKNGWDIDATQGYYATSLRPGALYLVSYIIGLQFSSKDVLHTVIDLSEEIQAFLDGLEAKKGKKDDDVNYAITAIKRLVAHGGRMIKDNVRPGQVLDF